MSVQSVGNSNDSLMSKTLKGAALGAAAGGGAYLLNAGQAAKDTFTATVLDNLGEEIKNNADELKKAKEGIPELFKSASETGVTVVKDGVENVKKFASKAAFSWTGALKAAGIGAGIAAAGAALYHVFFGNKEE